MRNIFLACLLMTAAASEASALQSRVLLSGGEAIEGFRAEESLTAAVNCLEKKNWTALKPYATAEGLRSLSELAERTHPVNVNPLYEAKLIRTPDGGLEAREFKVMVNLQGMQGNPYQYLVFGLTPEGLIADARYSLDRHSADAVLQPGVEPVDEACRMQILQFLEIFRTAYNREDIEFLRQVYSEDALIIVGKVISPKPGERSYFENSRLSREKIAFIQLSKKEYISRLQEVFKANEFVKVGFSNVDVRRHPGLGLVYGVTLKQEWRSSSYSDSGWLFLMIDFRDPVAPQIHVRSWQPDRFADGSVVSLGDFEVID